MYTKIHFRPFNPKQILLFPERLDKDIAENDPVRVVDTVIDELKLDNFQKLYKKIRSLPIPSQDDAKSDYLWIHE